MTPQQFVHTWKHSQLKEKSGAQPHFIDLCRLVGHPAPHEADPSGESFTFEAFAAKQTGYQGYADVWKKGFFAWEYKGKHAQRGSHRRPPRRLPRRRQDHGRNQSPRRAR